MAEPDLVTQLTQILTDAEERGDRPGAAWSRYTLAHAHQVTAQLDAIEALLLSLIPARERGALTAQLIEERVPRIAAAVNTAVTQAKLVADELSAEDQQRREQRCAAVEAEHD